MIASLSICCYGQKREIRKATKIDNYRYGVEFKNHYSEKKINKALSKQGYRLLTKESGYVKTYGDVTQGIKYITFVANDQYYAYQRSKESVKRKNRRSQNTTQISGSDVAAVGAAVGVGYLLYQGAKMLFRSDGSSSTPRNGYLKVVADDEWKSRISDDFAGNGVKYLKVTLLCGSEYLTTDEVLYYPNSNKPYSYGLFSNFKTLRGALDEIAKTYRSSCN